ncbi:MAG: hypothetical protein HKN60_00820 [Rhizobiales bacterium]|nr:hypothetical protein [Hyphomicrobiales bacterium]
MTVELDQIVRVGQVSIAALVESSIHRGYVHSLSFYGAKHPVAVLIHREDQTTAFEIGGPPIALDELDRRYPGQCARFKGFLVTDGLPEPAHAPLDRTQD